MGAKALVRALSLLVSTVSLFMALCMGAAFILGEHEVALKAFLAPVLLGLSFFPLASVIIKGKTELSPRGGYLFVSLSWLVTSSFGALPFILSGAIPSIPSAIFESMSGFTTTGATVLTDIEILPRSLLLWRATTHWLGGMGIVVLTVAVFPLLGLNGRALMEAESPGPKVDKFTPRLSQTAAILWLIYLGLTLLLTVLLLFGGMDLIDAITHAFATMATGGFSTRNASVGGFNSAYIEWVITIFMVLAGTNFGIHWRLLRGDIKGMVRDSEWRVYLGIFLCASIFASLNLFFKGSFDNPADAFRSGAFHAASILTTTGFGAGDYLQWPAFAQTVLFILMFIGGCAGSTAGGVKVGRILTLFKMGVAELRYLVNPRGIYGVFVGKNYMHKKVVYDIAAMVYLYLGLLLLSTLVVSTGGFDILTSFSATLACLGNIGPGFSLVGPALNYAFFPEWIKLLLSFIMLTGRLEVFTVIVLFTKAFRRA